MPNQGRGTWMEYDANGNAVWRDKAGNEIMTIDGTNRKVTFPSGSELEAQSGATVDLPAAGIERADLAADLAQSYGLMLWTHQGGALAVSEAAGTFNRSVSSNVILIQGEVTDNETEASVGTAQFRLPAEYVAGGAITVRLRCTIVKTGSATDNGSTIDVEAYKSDGSGAVGSDICATAAATFAALDTWYNKDFTITPTGLVAGDILNFKITSSIIDSEAGAGTLRLNMEQPAILLSIKG